MIDDDKKICPICACYVHLHSIKTAKRCLVEMLSPGNKKYGDANKNELIENRMKDLEKIIKEIRGFIT